MFYGTNLAMDKKLYELICEIEQNIKELKRALYPDGYVGKRGPLRTRNDKLIFKLKSSGFTLKEIARKADVSISTVERSLGVRPQNPLTKKHPKLEIDKKEESDEISQDL